MIQVTKIFRFEMAHAIHQYPGNCKHVHGHSYQLHVTVAAPLNDDTYLPNQGYAIDFKALKHWVQSSVLNYLDHATVLSKAYIADNNVQLQQERLQVWEAEPTAENMLVYIRHQLEQIIPPNVSVTKLVLYETQDSYAEWLPSVRN